MKSAFENKNKQLWSMVLALFIVLFAMFNLKKCSRPHPAPFAKDFVKSGGDTLDVAIELNPSIYAPSGDSIKGRDYQVLASISSTHGIPIKFHPFVPLKHALDGLEAGQYDLVAASMPLTTDLKDRFLMTDPVYLDREILVQLSDSTGHGAISSQIQLGGDTLWIPSDSPIADRISNLAEEIGDSIYIRSNPEYSAEYLFMLVARGAIKHAVINENIAQALHADYPQVDISTPVSFTQFQSWAINKNNTTLLDSINSWLNFR